MSLDAVVMSWIVRIVAGGSWYVDVGVDVLEADGGVESWARVDAMRAAGSAAEVRMVIVTMLVDVSYAALRVSGMVR